MDGFVKIWNNGKNGALAQGDDCCDFHVTKRKNE